MKKDGLRRVEIEETVIEDLKTADIAIIAGAIKLCFITISL